MRLQSGKEKGRRRGRDRGKGIEGGEAKGRRMKEGEKSAPFRGISSAPTNNHDTGNDSDYMNYNSNTIMIMIIVMFYYLTLTITIASPMLLVSSPYSHFR